MQTPKLLSQHHPHERRAVVAPETLFGGKQVTNQQAKYPRSGEEKWVSTYTEALGHTHTRTHMDPGGEGQGGIYSSVPGWVLGEDLRVRVCGLI